MGCKHWGQPSLLPTGLFPSQHKALLSWCSRRAAAVTQQIKRSNPTTEPLCWSHLRYTLVYCLAWNEMQSASTDLRTNDVSLTSVGAASRPITLRRLRFVQKRYAAYCCNNPDKRVPARSRCVDTVGTTRCLQDKSSNLGPDFCHHGNDFTSPPKYLTQLLLKLIRYIETPPIWS